MCGSLWRKSLIHAGGCLSGSPAANRLHWMRDETFAEDKSRIRTNNGPQQLATTRNAAIAVCRANDDPELAAARRDFAGNPSRRFAILGFLNK